MDKILCIKAGVDSSYSVCLKYLLVESSLTWTISHTCKLVKPVSVAYLTWFCFSKWVYFFILPLGWWPFSTAHSLEGISRLICSLIQAFLSICKLKWNFCYKMLPKIWRSNGPSTITLFVHEASHKPVLCLFRRFIFVPYIRRGKITWVGSDWRNMWCNFFVKVSWESKDYRQFRCHVWCSRYSVTTRLVKLLANLVGNRRTEKLATKVVGQVCPQSTQTSVM